MTLEHTEQDGALEEAQALTHLGSWQWDVASNTITWSDELYRLYGLRPRERQVDFDAFIAMIHPDDQAHVQTVISAAFESGKPFDFEHRIIRPDGETRELHGLGKVIKDRAGKPLRMLGTSQDVTERNQAEYAMRQSDRRFRAVTQASHDLVYDLNVATDKVWCNGALETEYGYDQAGPERTRQWWQALIHPDDITRVKRRLTRLFEGTRNTWDTEYRFQKADGTYAVVRDRAIVLRDSDGQPERMIGSYLDMTQQKQLDRAKDEFISLASHQLRTPLTVIRMYSEMLTDDMVGDISLKQREHISRITEASTRLINLVGEMLTMSRLELEQPSPDPEPTDVNHLIQSYVDELKPKADAKQVSLQFQPTAAKAVLLDPTSFGQVIHNLIDNAITYVPAGTGMIEVGFTQDAAGSTLQVQDNGIGIPLEDQPHIFQRFYRAENADKLDADGSGLGLYLVKLIVTATGGSIECDSTPDIGSTFTVRLPAPDVP